MTQHHYLSFDIEEHFQVSAFATSARRQLWERSESRVERNTDKLLALLAAQKAKATFFILGWVAERHPGLVERIVAGGHEVASHGYGHEMITSQTPEQFREDVRRAKRVLEEITGAQIDGYRAPSFTITKATMWALPILVEEGYKYDSSVFPVMHDRYGMPGANPFPHEITTTAGTLLEIPPTTCAFLTVRIPIAGGGYFRLFPYPLLKGLLRRVEKQGHSLVMYLHPWELDPEQPRMKGSLLSCFRHYLNLEKTEPRLIRLLTDFSFVPLRAAL